MSAPPAAGPGFPLAVRYDVEPIIVQRGEEGANSLFERDFRTIAEMGLDHAVLRHVEDGDRLALLDLASRSGLALAVPDRAVRHYVLTGGCPPGCRGPADIVRRLPGELLAHPALWAIVVETYRGPEALRRCDVIGDALRNRGLRLIRLDGGDHQTRGSDDGSNNLIAIKVAAEDGGREGSSTERWLGQLHEGLMTGRTGGLVVDRYRCLPGDRTALVIGDEPPSSAALTAIRETGLRARSWGARLAGLTPESVMANVPRADDLVMTAFVRGPRRYVLLFNRSLTRYVRAQVTLPDMIGDKPADRAVEVSPTTEDIPGRVFKANRRGIPVSVDLRPGGAVLFEMF